MDRQFGEHFNALGLETAFAPEPEADEAALEAGRLDFGEQALLVNPLEEDEGPFGEQQVWLGEVLEAEDEAIRSSDAEWLETEWLDTSAEATPGGESLEAFAERIGREWSRRMNGEPGPEARRDRLIQDHRDTQTGAAIRRRNSGKEVTDAFVAQVTRGWMISREEQMRFETESGKGVAALGPFAPPAGRVPLIDDALIGGSRDTVRKGKTVVGAKIAPFTLRFARALRSRHGSVGMTNYHGHGGGAFNNRGYSLDLWLSATDDRGFYRQDEAIRLLRAVHAAARAVGGRWRAIYNDFTVADTINRELRRRHVIFMGTVRRNKAKQVAGLNWHGPNPLILHVHLDITPISGVDQGEAEQESYEDREDFEEFAARSSCACKGGTLLRPRDDKPYSPSRSKSVGESQEDLAWLAYEDEALSPDFEEEEEQGFGGEQEWPGEEYAPADEWQAFDGASKTAYFGLDAEEEGGEALGSGPFQALLNADEALAEEIYFAEDGEFFHEAFDCSAPIGPNECEFPGQKKIIPAGNKKGLVLTRNVNDPSTELSLQFADYDINATNPQKEEHNNGVARITEFILSRVRAGSAEVVVHLSGSASLTDRAEYNRRLSCQRARCLASTIRLGLDRSPNALRSTRFVIDNKAFDEAICRKSPDGKGENCELGEFRSVRVTVTGPAGKVIPVPINPRHDQFEIRVCRFASKSLSTVLIDELLAKLPDGIPRGVAEKIAKILKSKLMEALKKRAPKLLSRAFGAISGALKWIPIEIVRQTATFQIRERKKRETPGQKTEIRSITLCYEGWGGRLAIPYDTLVLDGIDQMLGKIKELERQPLIKRLLREVLSAILKPFLSERLKLIGSETPGDWKPFITKNKMLIEQFAGQADIMIDLLSSMVDPGTIHLGFNSHEFNSKTNASFNVLQCGDCSGPIIPLTVKGGGFDIWCVSTGSMGSKNCVCVGGEAESFDAEQTLFFAPTESEQTEYFQETLYDYPGEALSADVSALEALLEADIGPGEAADRVKGATTFMLGPTLRRGSSGPAVESLQRALVRIGTPVTGSDGNAPLVADGKFGPATERAVQRFQKMSGLTPDGIVGALTKAAIAAALGGGQVTTTVSPFSVKLYPTEMAPDAGHNARLASALLSVRQTLPGSKQAMLDKAAMIIVRLTPSGQMTYAGVREDEMFFSGSLLKVSLLYASFELAERVNAMAPQISATSATDFFSKVGQAFDARIAAAVPQIPVGAWQKVAFDNVLDAVPAGQGFAVKLNGKHLADLERIFADQNQNVAARDCMQRLGFSFVNGNADAAGFFGVVSQKGIWMATDYSPPGRINWPSFNIPVVTGTSSAAMTALSMANLVAQFKRGQLINATASREMLRIFQRGGSWLSLLPNPATMSFTAMGAKVGHSASPSAKVPSVKSEAALFRRKTDGAEFLTVWQNVPDTLDFAPIYDVIDEVIKTWP